MPRRKTAPLFRICCLLHPSLLLVLTCSEEVQPKSKLLQPWFHQLCGEIKWGGLAFPASKKPHHGNFGNFYSFLFVCSLVKYHHNTRTSSRVPLPPFFFSTGTERSRDSSAAGKDSEIANFLVLISPHLPLGVLGNVRAPACRRRQKSESADPNDGC